MNIKEEDNNSEDSNKSNATISDTSNENGKRIKRRSTKKQMHVENRKRIMDELNEMLGFDKRNSVVLWELERNDRLKQRLRELAPEIKKCHKVSSWGYYSSDVLKGMNHEIGLLKSLYKNEGYKILTRRIMYDCEGTKKLQTELYFIKE